jgi:hypothetical protein
VFVGGAIGLIGVVARNASQRPAPVARAPLVAQPSLAPEELSYAVASPSSFESFDRAGEGAPASVRPHPQKEALAEMDNVQFMFRDFRTRLGENPTGTNAEIMSSVMGRNFVQGRFGPPQGQQINDQGELLDRWGTPYFFHQLSKNEMEIRSAGPDHTLWTVDDLVSK